MFAHINLVLFNAAICHCFAQFEMFPGFEGQPPSKEQLEPIDTESIINTITHETQTDSKTTTTESPDFNCPENEKPLNIGAYEVPTQRDLVLLVRKTLTKKFQSYSRKAFFLLRDIKEVSKVAALVAHKCPGNKYNYKKCVRKVNDHCEVITKKLISTVEEYKRNMTSFTQGKVCNMAAMVTDPLELVKTLAAEEVSLKFAMPAFLRLLSDCRVYCRLNYTLNAAKKPTRRLSDQAFLVKHILTNKVRDSNIGLK